MNWLRRLWRCYAACAVVVLTLQLLFALLALSVLLGLGFLRVPLLSERLDTPAPARTTPVISSALPSPMEQRLFQAARQGSPIRLDVTQIEINNLLADLNARKTGPLRHMKVDLLNEQAAISGQLPGPLPIPLQVWGKVRASRGLISFYPDRAFSGDIPLPTILVEPFIEWINTQIRQSMLDRKIPLSVDTVELRDGLAIIRGTLPEGWRPATLPEGFTDGR